ncbi:MAG TPA: DinB family protein [Bryobacteraceae bacterium]|nr:DinB family protein [Bryobacteraceae bacterium]
MLSVDALRQLLDYAAWASRRLVEAAALLAPEELTRDFGTADHSVLGTLGHIYFSETVWLARFERRPQPARFPDAGALSLAEIQNGWPQVQQRLNQWAAELTSESAQAPLAYQDLKGRPWSQPPWQLVLHMVNHGTHHRGQVSGFLRTLGHTPPQLDLIAFYRQPAAGA